jgi:hypothetical protein
MLGTVNISKDIRTRLPLKMFDSRTVRVLCHRLHGTGHDDRLLVVLTPTPSQARTINASMVTPGGAEGGGRDWNLKTHFVDTNVLRNL